MRQSFFLSTALGLLGLGVPAAASAASADIAPSVDELVVTANRSPERADRVGQQVTVITAEQLRAQQTPILSEVLSRTPGVSFSRNGGVGTATQVNIRGAETGQTLILIDGVKLNDPTSVDTSFNFGNLLLGDVDHIEVLRGPQSVLWGSQAIGGVVNLITADPKGPFESDLTAEGGSHGWGYGRAAVGGKTDQVSWRTAVGYLNTGGISVFDQAKGGREPDSFHNLGASAKARVTLTDQLSLDLRAVYSRSRTDLDGFLPDFSFGDTPEFSRSEDLAAYAGANLGLFDERLQNRLAFTETHEVRKNYDPRQAPSDVTFSAFGHTERFEYEGVYAIAQGWTAVFGAEREQVHMRTASPFSTVARSADLDSGYAQVRGDVLPNLTLTAGLRHDHHDTFGGHTVGQASAAWRLNGGNTILRASWGQGFKAPSLYQLGSEFGNAALRPESSAGWDAGVEQRLLDGRVVLSGDYFERHTKDQIDFVSCFGSPPLPALCATHPAGGFYDNIARTRARGVELSGVADLTDALSLAASYTWTDARNDAAGDPNFDKRLARRPEHQAYAEASYRWPVKLTTAVAVQYSSERFDDAANLNRVKGFTLMDLRASYPLSAQLEVYGRIENLFDKRYETVRNYGQLGRTAYAGLRARF